MVALVGRTGNYNVAYDVAVEVKAAPEAAEAATECGREIVKQGLSSTRSMEGARRLMGTLLDGKEDVRRAALLALSRWLQGAPYSEVVGGLLAELASAEKEHYCFDALSH